MGARRSRQGALGEAEGIADVHRENGLFLRVRRASQGVNRAPTVSRPRKNDIDFESARSFELEAAERHRRIVERDGRRGVRAEHHVHEVRASRKTAVAPVRERELPAPVRDREADAPVAEKPVSGSESVRSARTTSA